MIGSKISHYEILEKLGEGGMGVLYRARDTHLDRTVAIKVLLPDTEGDASRNQRFVQEAKAASALNHPNIVTVYDADRLPDDEQYFIAMEYIDGEPLDARIGEDGLPIEDAVRYAREAADALAAAHAADIVHRDIKPANLMVTASGRIKVLDFGLAKLVGPPRVDTSVATRTAGPRTEKGVVMGTPSYMSPEQSAGDPIDARSDLFSLGCVLYEMLTGKRPFMGESNQAVIRAILHDRPTPPREIRSELPPALERVVLRCLEKNPSARYPSAEALAKALADFETQISTSRVRLAAVLREPRYGVPMIAGFVAIAAGLAWWGVESSRVRWARNTALPEVARLSDADEFDAAFRLASQAREILGGDDPALRTLWPNLTRRITILSTPPGVDVSIKGYLSVGADWIPVGRTPLEDVELPDGFLRWRFAKDGYETLDRSDWSDWGELSVELQPEGELPEGMVRVPGGSYRLFNRPQVELEDFLLDRYEVTNEEFMEFVDAGGYREKRYWKHRFLKNGEELAWEEAMRGFIDQTGRPGPSTWELGTYPEGQENYPVTGVSWYEASAYAEFTGKSLPTIYHWYYASGGVDTRAGPSSDIVYLSNFEGDGPAPVGSYQGMAPYGSYDMAGNVKEWCWNEADEGRRYILGGGWDEPLYMFREPDARSPFDRNEANGFRTVRYVGDSMANAADVDRPGVLRACPFKSLHRDYSEETPVTDEVFEHLRSLYVYDRTGLEPEVEDVDDTSEHWRMETVSFEAAYAEERVTAYLFLPRGSAPPYQTVVYFPGAASLFLKSSKPLYLKYLDFVIRSGRAVLYPVYQGMYERQSGFQWRGPRSYRDVNIHWSQDLSRSIDYLETREDIDSEKLAFFGLSLGANRASILCAMEGRFKAAILLAGGLPPRSVNFPETDPFNFAPRAEAPLLLLNGREDFVFPLETSQLPLLRHWGAPEEDKHHVLFDSGHMPPKNPMIKAILDFLDRYLGGVEHAS
jgi:formylglycine-generating enzyme required for sulfatase activity/dienelactone hydrolase/predicted Ser/Thr protein kinase